MKCQNLCQDMLMKIKYFSRNSRGKWPKMAFGPDLGSNLSMSMCVFWIIFQDSCMRIEGWVYFEHVEIASKGLQSSRISSLFTPNPRASTRALSSPKQTISSYCAESLFRENVKNFIHESSVEKESS